MDDTNDLRSNNDPFKPSSRSSTDMDLPSAYDRGVRDSKQRLRKLVQQSYAELSSIEPPRDDFLPGLSQPSVSSRSPRMSQSSAYSKRHKSVELARPALTRSHSAQEEHVDSSQSPTARPRTKTVGEVDRDKASPSKRQSRLPEQPTIEEPSVDLNVRPLTSPTPTPAYDASLTPDNPGPSKSTRPSYVAPPSPKFLLHLMHRTKGHFQGLLYYRTGSSPDWTQAYCVLCPTTGSLLRDTTRGKFADDEVIVDLHAPKVQASYDSSTGEKTIHVSGKGQQRVCHLRPLDPSEFNSWYAALICWQAAQRPRSLEELDLSDAQLTPVSISTRRERRRSREDRSSRDSSIVKTAKFGLWCRDDTTKPLAKESVPNDISNMPSTVQQPCRWIKISCILNENGDFKLLTNVDAKEVAMIPLAKLPRSAIQRLSPSVLKNNYVIGIFPQYVANPRTLSRLQPLYLSCESKPQYELWFVLLRAFTIPELYGPPKNKEADSLRSQEALPGLSSSATQSSISSLFRVERSLELQILEYKSGIVSDIAENEDDLGSHTPSDALNTFSEHYAQVLVDGIVRAKTRPKNANTMWYQTFEILDLPPTASFVTIQVRELECLAGLSSQQFSLAQGIPELTTTSGELDENTIKTDSLVGEMILPLGDAQRLADDNSNTRWPLIDEEGKTVKTLSLKMRLNRNIVLADQEYSVLSELLHDFTNALTLQIADVIPAELSRLSDCLLNIFQVSGGAKDWLISLAEEEIDGIRKPVPHRRFGYHGRLNSNDSKESLAPQEREGLARDMAKATIAEANLLFRGNTLLSKALDAHMQRLGKDYLEETLGEKLREIAELDPDVEVDPTKISATASLHFNWVRLHKIVHDVWDEIRKSASRCPGELRAIFRHIKSCAEEKYAYCLKTVPYSSVSGFLFLRFFCPAILNPHLFDLVESYPRPRALRSFTLIAKTLQGLANQSTFGSKEPWMEPMNKFLNEHKTDFRDFIDEICIYSTSASSGSSSQYYAVALSTFSRLPTACKEGYLSLPYLIDETRGFAALVDIWLDNFDPHKMNQPLEYELLQFHNECLNLRKKTQDLFRHAERGAKRSGTLEEKLNGLVTLMQANPEDFWIGFSEPSSDHVAAQSERPAATATAPGDEGLVDIVTFASEPPQPATSTRRNERRPSAAQRWRSRSRSRTASPLRTGEYDSGPSGTEEEIPRPESTNPHGKSRESKRHGLFGRRRKPER